jgi:hypothetical protein
LVVLASTSVGFASATEMASAKKAPAAKSKTGHRANTHPKKRPAAAKAKTGKPRKTGARKKTAHIKGKPRKANKTQAKKKSPAARSKIARPSKANGRKAPSVKPATPRGRPGKRAPTERRAEERHSAEAKRRSEAARRAAAKHRADAKRRADADKRAEANKRAETKKFEDARQAERRADAEAQRIEGEEGRLHDLDYERGNVVFARIRTKSLSCAEYDELIREFQDRSQNLERLYQKTRQARQEAIRHATASQDSWYRIYHEKVLEARAILFDSRANRRRVFMNMLRTERSSQSGVEAAAQEARHNSALDANGIPNWTRLPMECWDRLTPEHILGTTDPVDGEKRYKQLVRIFHPNIGRNIGIPEDQRKTNERITVVIQGAFQTLIPKKMEADPEWNKTGAAKFDPEAERLAQEKAARMAKEEEAAGFTETAPPANDYGLGVD